MIEQSNPKAFIRLSLFIIKLIQDFKSEKSNPIRKSNLEIQLRGCFQGKDFIYCFNCGKFVTKNNPKRVDYFCNKTCYDKYQKKKWWN